MTKVYVFDAYGTLFDVHSAAARHAGEIGPNWEQMSRLWRTKHLEYTWVHALIGRHTSFWQLAARSLDHAAAAFGGLPDETKTRLLVAYHTLAAYPEVPSVLSRLRSTGAKVAILTNGNADMIADAVNSAGLSGAFDEIITVHEAGVFKPDMRVYRLVTERFECRPADVSFQSSNRWDIAGANAFGFQTVWINRTGLPDEYPEMPADRVSSSLADL
jgi:2-haloacid dehalogenase